MLGAALSAPSSAATAQTNKPQESACSASFNEKDILFQVPFRVVDGRIYTDVQINGQGPFTFAIDTGASGLGRADMSLVQKLSLPFIGDGSASDGVTTRTVSTVRLNRLEIGGYVAEAMEVMARDYSGRMAPEWAIAGIIGRDFFSDGTLVIDYPAKTVTYVRSSMIDPSKEGTLGYKRPFRVPVRIGDTTVEANLDTGANVEMVMPENLYRQFSDEELAAAGDAILTNNNLQTQQGTVPGPIRLGSVELADVPARVSDRFPEMMVGARVLQNYRILIDQRASVIAICP